MPQGFLEDKLDDVVVSGRDSAFVVSLIPYEQTTTYIKGTSNGPEAIVEASGHIELFDETLGVDASTHGVATVRPRITDLSSITAHARELQAAHGDALLCFLGGEHSVTPALIEGVAQGDIGIVWVDAHADLRSSFHGRADNHACAGYHSAAFGPIVQVGIRSLAEAEMQYLEASDSVQAFRLWSEQAKEAIMALPDSVYLTIDLDGIDPTLMRAVGTPEPGGLLWDEVIDIVDVVFAEKKVVACDVVELCPNPQDVVSSYTAARLVYKVMAYHTWHNLEGRDEP